eukprot:5446179-Amphidinium_carterae.1
MAKVGFLFRPHSSAMISVEAAKQRTHRTTKPVAVLCSASRADATLLLSISIQRRAKLTNDPTGGTRTPGKKETHSATGLNIQQNTKLQS